MAGFEAADGGVQVRMSFNMVDVDDAGNLVGGGDLSSLFSGLAQQAQAAQAQANNQTPPRPPQGSTAVGALSSHSCLCSCLRFAFILPCFCFALSFLSFPFVFFSRCFPFCLFVFFMVSSQPVFTSQALASWGRCVLRPHPSAHHPGMQASSSTRPLTFPSLSRARK